MSKGYMDFLSIFSLCVAFFIIGALVATDNSFSVIFSWFVSDEESKAATISGLFTTLSASGVIVAGYMAYRSVHLPIRTREEKRFEIIKATVKANKTSIESSLKKINSYQDRIPSLSRDEMGKLLISYAVLKSSIILYGFEDESIMDLNNRYISPCVDLKNYLGVYCEEFLGVKNNEEWVIKYLTTHYPDNIHLIVSRIRVGVMHTKFILNKIDVFIQEYC